MYMAPIQRTRGGQRGGGVKFLFGLSVFLGVAAGVGYIFLVGQASRDYQVQASLDNSDSLQTAASRTRTGGTHALWTGRKPGSQGNQAPAGPASIGPAPEAMIKPSQVDRIAPGSGRADPPAASKNSKATPRRVAQLPTRRPVRVRTNQKNAANRASAKRRTRSVAQTTTADMIGLYRIQVGSFRTPEAAQDRWISLRHRHKDLLGRYIMVIEKVSRGRRGVVYRLQAGPLKSRGAVSRVCNRLSKRRIGCSLVDG